MDQKQVAPYRTLGQKDIYAHDCSTIPKMRSKLLHPRRPPSEVGIGYDFTILETIDSRVLKTNDSLSLKGKGGFMEKLSVGSII